MDDIRPMNSIEKIVSFVNEFGEGNVFKTIGKIHGVDLPAFGNLSIAP